MQELKNLAVFAAESKIKGNSLSRNALLKPLTIILDELELCPNPADPNELELVRAGTKDMIFEHIRRVAKTDFKPGRTKESKVHTYVDMFFDEVLGKAHQGKANRLLGRERLIKSAYLMYYRQRLAELQAAKKATTTQNALDAIGETGDDDDVDEAE